MIAVLRGSCHRLAGQRQRMDETAAAADDDDYDDDDDES